MEAYRKIKSVLCPNCKTKQMGLKEIDEKLLKEVSDLARKTLKHKFWVCPDCVGIYPEGWFDQFKQLEEFVTR